MKILLRYISAALFAVMLLGTLASCKKEEPVVTPDDSEAYSSGYDDGYAVGKQEGYDQGVLDGSKTDNGNTDNGNTDNGNTDNGNTDSGNADNGNTDSGNTDNGNTDSGKFDENNIVLSFGSLSDIHLTGTNDQSEEYFKAAIAQLKSQAALHDKDGLDAIGIAGDIANRGSEAQVKQFANIVKGTDLKNVMLTTGNHDYYDTAYATLPNYKTVLGDKYFESATDLSMINKGAYHCVVNGYHFIFLEPTNYKSYCPYDAEVMEWLDNTLKTITDNDPDAYVFVYTHPMLYATTYGSTELSDQTWATIHLTTTLSKYPQVVTFSGHLHFPINDERSIMQTEFTSLGCGSVRYLAIERGFSNVSGTKPGDCYEVSSGLLVQVDANGNLRITRMYFSKNTTFKEPWELSHPTSDGSHLEKYSFARAHENEAPVLSGKPTVALNENTSTTGTNANVTVTFPAATDDDLIHHYEVTVTNKANGVSESYKFLSDYYIYDQPSKMAKTISHIITLGSVTDDGYTIDVVAVDTWGRKSGKISCDYSMKDISDAMSAVLPDVYTDFNFENGAVTDTKGKFNVTMNGATVSNTTLTFAGKTNTVGALNITASGQNAKLTFKEYSATTVTNFFNNAKGYTVEALYINRDQSGKQAAVGGTQGGGFAIAENEGIPYFYVYTEDGSINITAENKTSTTSLNHVVATVLYDENTDTTYATLYINGKLVATGSKSGKVKPIDNADIANAFCFGADVNGATKYDHPMTNFSIADVKVYDSALNFKQVETAYTNAVNGFTK